MNPMINVLEPKSTVLQQFVDSIYLFKKCLNKLEFTAYPSVNTPVALMRNAKVKATNQRISIEASDFPNHFGVVCNQFFNSSRLHYSQQVDEIAINFKPLGFASFARTKPEKQKLFSFSEWNGSLPVLFDTVFELDDPEMQLYHIEKFLLEQYVPLRHESHLLEAVRLLADTLKEYKMQDIADCLGIHYKNLYRQFTQNVGCTPSHYRKLIKFRNSVVSKSKKGKKARLVDISNEQDYTDQSYFNRQFKHLTGENPTRFFKEISSFGNEKVIFKIGVY